MCEFCVKHGEGKKWYLNAKNYSDDLLNDMKRRKFIEGGFGWINNIYNTRIKFLKFLPLQIPMIGNIFRKIIKCNLLYEHWGQVVPIEDVAKILNFTNSVTRIPCICRKVVKGKDVRTCFAVSLDPNKILALDIADKSFFGKPDVSKFEKVDKKFALDFMRESETHGMIHTIWTFKAPFTCGLCNCELSAGCLGMKMYEANAPITFRAEYVSLVDKDSCIGCQECLKVCQFGAIAFDKKMEKVKIDLKKCYGCGICRTVCKKNAITLVDRNSIAEAASLW